MLFVYVDCGGRCSVWFSPIHHIFHQENMMNTNQIKFLKMYFFSN